jgi:hypothetical protein
MCDAIPLLSQYTFTAWCLLSDECVFMAWYLVKHKENFIFSLTQATPEIWCSEVAQVLEHN